MALQRRRPGAGLVQHPDRGVQYAANGYVDLLKQHEITISMSRRANPYDKAYASYCTSCEPCETFSGKRRRFESLTPCALRGASGPGSSYSHRSLSLAG